MLKFRWTALAILPVVAAALQTSLAAAQETRREKESFSHKERAEHKSATQVVKPVSLKAAQTIIEAARLKAEKIGVPQNIAVVDDGGNLVAFARMDGAWLGSIEIAQDKAYTARAFNISTKELAEKSQPGKPLFGIAQTHRGRIIIFAGGIPLKVHGRVVGAIGVSGGTPDQDHEVAEAGVASFVPGGKTGERKDRTGD